MLRDAQAVVARRNSKLMAGAVSLFTALALVTGAVTAQASQPSERSVYPASIQAKDPGDPLMPEHPAPEPSTPKVELAPGTDRNASPDRGTKGLPVQTSAAATAAATMRVVFDAPDYHGQDPVMCYQNSLTLIQGRQHVVCATMFPTDSAGNPTTFSPSNTIRLTVQDGCGAIASDLTYTNIYTGGTSPNVLAGYTPIGSGVLSIPWSACSVGWVITFTFTGSTLDGTAVNSSATATVDTTPPPPPPALDQDQTRGGDPRHSTQGDPVDSLTGAFNYHPDRPDMAYAARGIDLTFNRNYSSDITRSGRFGPGWSDSYDATLGLDPATGNVTYHDPSGSLQKFTVSGTTYTAPAGVLSQLTKTAAGWSLLLKDQTVLSFDATGTLTTIVDRNSQGSTLAYTNGKLTSVSASGRTLTLTYNALGLVDHVTGSDGRLVGYQYDPSGRLQGYVDAAGFTTAYAYDGNGLLASIKDPNGNYPVRSTYDATTRRVTQQQDADGKVTSFSWTQTGADSGTGTATVTDPRGFTVTDSYVNGFLVTQADADGKISRFDWNFNGSLLSTVDRLGNSTFFYYDGRGNLLNRRGPNNVIEKYSYNARNDITAVTDFSGRQFTYSYDAAGNLATVNRPSIAGGSGVVVSRRYVYNPDGTLQSVADALGRTTSYGYNAQGDLISTTTPEGRVTTSTVDAAGRVDSVVEPRGTISGANPDTYRTRMTWDQLDRVTSTTDPLGHTTTTAFDPAGRVDHTTDAKGGLTSFTYGATANPLTVQGPDSSVGPQRYTYDPNGNLATTTSPAGNTTTFTYTGNNARKTVSSTGTGTWTYDYDAAGRLAKATAPSLRSVTLTRNPQGQVSKLTYSDGTPAVSYTYDATGNRYSMTDTQGTTYYSYNAVNGLTSVARSGIAQFLYTYDEAGQLSTRQIPDGSGTTQYTYDRDSRMTGVSAGNQTLAAYAYDNATGTVTTTLPGGVSNTLQIDAAGRPTVAQAKKGTTTLTRSQYSLDELGNPTQIQNADGTTDSYAYSPLSRLTAACYGATTCSAGTATAAFRYSYDGDSNITSVIQPAGTSTYTYDSAGRLSSRAGLKGAATYQYDADGNTTSNGTAAYSWNAAGQLTKVTAGTSTTSYAYDGDNHRVGVTVGRTTNTNSYDPVSGALVLEQSGGKVLRRYDYGTSLISMKSGTSTSSYLTDALGSVRGVASSTGALSLSYSYNPFGDARATITGKSAPENPLQFTGAPLTAPLYQMGARDYSPADGRFLSPDPAGTPGRGYTYAGGNPLANTDPSGLSEYDWREMVNRLASGIADVAGNVALVCTVTVVVCGEVAPAAGVLSLVASAVSVATSEQTSSCLSGHSSCPEAIVSAAIVAGSGKFGVGGRALAERATSIHSLLDPIAQNMRTTAVLSTKEGVNVLSSGGRDLTRQQRAMAGADDMIALSPTDHAEVTAVNGALKAGLTPNELGTSRAICPVCRSFLEGAGATITSPNTAKW